MTINNSNSSLPDKECEGRNALWACLCAGDILLRREGANGAFSLPIGDEPPVPLQPWNMVTQLKIGKEQPTLNVVRLDRPVSDIQGIEMMPLRTSFHVLDSHSYALAGKAAELIYWDQNTKFCGCCGAPMKLHTEISKRCINCGKEVWPQLATAVIVRITRPIQATDDEEILLVHANNFRRDYYGLVAGFVETGETLEEAVRREVREETGLEIKDINYFGSQPWPFPCGLMVGFTAHYASGDIHLQRSELQNGGWFKRTSLPHIPDKASIARSLIDDWLES